MSQTPDDCPSNLCPSSGTVCQEAAEPSSHNNAVEHNYPVNLVVAYNVRDNNVGGGLSQINEPNEAVCPPHARDLEESLTGKSGLLFVGFIDPPARSCNRKLQVLFLGVELKKPPPQPW